MSMSSEERWKKQFLIDNDWDEIRERCLEVIRIIGHDIPIKKVATEDKYDV